MSNKKREFRTINLPSGGKAEIYTYFDRAAEREIQRAELRGIIVQGDTKAAKDEVHTLDELADMRLRKEDAIVLHGTRCVYDEKGSKSDMSNKVVDEMDKEDFICIYDELGKIFLAKKKK